MKGAIVVNPFRIPGESLKQAERLKAEFNLLGVEVSVIDNGYLRTLLCNGDIFCDLKDLDFIVYLDKDKYLSGALDKLGVRLFNSHQAVRVCDDKGETYLALANKGFNLPKTIFGALCYRQECEIDSGVVEHVGKTLGFPLIVKESFGSMGKGVYKADNISQLKEIMETVKLRPHLFQEYISTKIGVDVRVIVIGGKAVAAMERRNESDFRSNVARGGTGVEIELLQSFKQTAERVANVLGLDYCGVDLLYGKDNAPYVCEVNSNAFFQGIEEATGKNVAKMYAEYVIKTV